MASTVIKEVRAGNIRDGLIKEVSELYEAIHEIERKLGTDGQTIEEHRSCQGIKAYCLELMKDMDKTRRRTS